MRLPHALTVVVASGLLFATGCGKSGGSTAPPPPTESGAIEVLSAPPAAAIFLDGVATGTLTPDTLVSVPAGAHTVMLRLVSYADSIAAVTVQANSTSRVSITLRRVLSYAPPPIAFERRTLSVDGRLRYAAAGDFNGDGRVDLAVAGLGIRHQLRILVGGGDGTFAIGAMALDTTVSIQGLGSGDLNRDGRPDLVCLLNNGGEGRLVSWTGNGDGTFARAGTAVYAPSVTPVISPVFVSDVSGDGNPDVLLGYQAGSNTLGMAVWLGTGSGTLQPMTAYTRSFSNPIQAIGSPTGFAVADIDGDGRRDIVQGISSLSGSPGGVLLWRGSGGGGFAPATFLSTGGYCSDVALADLDRDGKLDLVVSQTGGSLVQGTVAVLIGRGDGTFGIPNSFPTGLYSLSLAIADFNGDARLDAATADQLSHTVSALGGTGDGWLVASPSVGVTPAPAVLLVADLDGDGRPDVLVLNRPVPEASPSTVDLLLSR